MSIDTLFHIVLTIFTGLLIIIGLFAVYNQIKIIDRFSAFVKHMKSLDEDISLNKSFLKKIYKRLNKLSPADLEDDDSELVDPKDFR